MLKAHIKIYKLAFPFTHLKNMYPLYECWNEVIN